MTPPKKDKFIEMMETRQKPLLTVPAGAAPPPVMVMSERQGLNSLMARGVSHHGNPICLAGQTHEHGLGAHADADICIQASAPLKHFHAAVGVDENRSTLAQKHRPKLVFSVEADGREIWKGSPVRLLEAPQVIELPLGGAHELKLRVRSLGDENSGQAPEHFAQADWADAHVTLQDGSTVWLDEAVTRMWSPPQVIASDKKPTLKGRFRYDTSGTWHKGNTHMHTQASDGYLTHREVADLYAGEGYDFIFFTDHNVLSNVGAMGPMPLLCIDGVEYYGTDSRGFGCEFVCLGATSLSQAPDMDTRLEEFQRQGAITILAHPYWAGHSFDNVLRHRFDGVEIYNHVCHCFNGKSSGVTYWDAMLAQRPATMGFAVDDAHFWLSAPVWNGGWIVVNSPHLTRESILEAIRRGNFYASRGPQFHSIRLEGNYVVLRTSPVRSVKLVGAGSQGKQWTADPSSEAITELAAELPDDWPYVRVEIEDENGRLAWTNSLFVL